MKILEPLFGNHGKREARVIPPLKSKRKIEEILNSEKVRPFEKWGDQIFQMARFPKEGKRRNY